MTTTNDFDTGVTLNTYADDVAGDGLLRIQWRNGEPKLDSPGRFFVPAENLGDFVPGEPWVRCREVFNDGTRAEGYKAETLEMAVLCARSQPFHWSAPMGEAGRYKVWQAKWIKGDNAPEYQAMQVEVLAYVKGFEHWGSPVVWTSATIKTSFAIIAQDGLLKAIDTAMVKPASAAAKQTLDRYCFWATIACKRTPKGDVDYTPTKGQPVTPPILVVPPEKERSIEWLRSRFTGRALIAETLAPWRDAYEEWRRETKSNDDTAAYDDEPAPATGRNVPQAWDAANEPIAGASRGEGGIGNGGRDLGEVKQLVDAIRAAGGDPGEISPRKIREMSAADYAGYVRGMRELLGFLDETAEVAR
jgi:hypothetical protein